MTPALAVTTGFFGERPAGHHDRGPSCGACHLAGRAPATLDPPQRHLGGDDRPPIYGRRRPVCGAVAVLPTPREVEPC